MMHVVLKREIRIVLPFRRSQRHPAFHDALAEAREAADETPLVDLLHARPVDRLVEQEQ